MISHLRRQIIELLRGINMEMVFAANGKLESIGVDTTSRAINQLPTRDVLHGQLGEMLTQHAVVSVAFMDLDNFKVVNDRLGHTPAGDRCLDDFVALVQVITLNKARFYRYAGDEFVLVFPNFTAAEAAATSERIRKAVADARLGGDTVDVTTSVGVASSDAFSEAATLVAAADDAMYAAKKVNGPNQVRVAPLTPDIAATAARERSEAKGR
jgi:diguanylate cyclase (GGDEF)-like protein